MPSTTEIRLSSKTRSGFSAAFAHFFRASRNFFGFAGWECLSALAAPSALGWSSCVSGAASLPLLSMPSTIEIRFSSKMRSSFSGAFANFYRASRNIFGFAGWNSLSALAARSDLGWSSSAFCAAPLPLLSTPSTITIRLSSKMRSVFWGLFAYFSCVSGNFQKVSALQKLPVQDRGPALQFPSAFSGLYFQLSRAFRQTKIPGCRDARRV